MPYARAHQVVLLLLVPIIGVAFWPGYFGDLGHASFAFHAHAVTATAWVLLVAAQSWTIHARRIGWHRRLGRAVFVLVPLFAAGGALAVHSMAVKFATKSHPFYAVFGARLGMDDLIATTALVLMVRAAIVQRRRVAVHAGYMLGTLILLVSPIMARLPLPRVPHLGEIAMAAIAALLYWRDPRHGRPFVVVGLLAVVRAVQFETIGASDAWAALFARLATVPAVLPALLAGGAAAAVLWPVYPRRPAPAAGTAPAAA